MVRISSGIQRPLGYHATIKQCDNEHEETELLGATAKAKCNMPMLQKLPLIAETGKDSWEFDATWLNRVPPIYGISSELISFEEWCKKTIGYQIFLHLQ